MTWWLDIIFHLRTPLGEVGFISNESQSPSSGPTFVKYPQHVLVWAHNAIYCNDTVNRGDLVSRSKRTHYGTIKVYR